MEGANFGDMNTVHSIRVDGRSGLRNLSQPKAAIKWLREHTDADGADSTDRLPCPAAEQLRHLFGKYIRPDGTPRRTWIGADVINRGSRHIPKPKQAIEAATKAKYLTLERAPGKYRDKYWRAEAPKYSEMVEFVKRSEASGDIRFLLYEICGDTSCPHIVG